MPAATRRALEEHAAAEAPNEACGLLALRDGVVERYIPCINVAASPYRFDLRVPDPAVVADAEDDGYELAVFHSHPTGSAEPSRTDVANIGLWEGRPYLILSRPTGELLAWTIAEGAASPLPLTTAEDQVT
ncbi:MAG TPA: Mov34/MPN/PAD-1 family protein [Gaiellaceae bacterium]